MKFFWIIPFFLLQDTEAFLIKSIRVKLCIQARLINRNLLLEDCSPESNFQDWSWQGSSGELWHTELPLHAGRWGMWKGPMSFQGSLQPWCCTIMGSAAKNTRHFSVHEVRLCIHGCVLPAWRDMLGNPGSEREAEAEHKYLPTPLASTHVDEHTAGNVTLPLGLEQQQLEELLWFFRREDPSTWNYSVLALSLATMILGLVLLTINIMRNRKRKILVNREAAQSTQEAELDAKQALMPVQEYSPAEPLKQEPGPQEQRPGDVMVQWKDGTVTSLYTEMSEQAI
ncbi:OSTB protein, partial [Thryothorus ludovicianus]|nr:OSTB protein [Thryothorus ludovicianus]